MLERKSPTLCHGKLLCYLPYPVISSVVRMEKLSTLTFPHFLNPTLFSFHISMHFARTSYPGPTHSLLITSSTVSSTICYLTPSVTSGVLQGFVLAPLLFLIFINDPLGCTSSPISLFADDSVIYRAIRTLLHKSFLSNITVTHSLFSSMASFSRHW